MAAPAPRNGAKPAPAPVQPGRNPVIERMLGDTGEPDRVMAAAESMAGRAVPLIAEALAPRLSFVPDIEVEAIDLVRFSEAMPGEKSFDMVLVAPSTISPDALTLFCDVETTSILVQAAFGGDRDVAPYRLQRALSPIERQLLAGLFDAAARALNGSGSRGLEIRLPLGEAQTAADAAKTPPRDGPAARMTFRLALGGLSGRLTAIVPQRVLVERRSDDGGASASHWRSRLNDEVMRSTVRLEATIALPKVSLGEVAGWQVGHTIEFPANAHADTRLSARRKPLFNCEFGRLGNHFTVRVNEPFDATQDFIDGLTRR